MSKRSQEVKREPLDTADLIQDTYDKFEVLKSGTPLSPQQLGRIEVIAEKAQELAVLIQQLLPGTDEAAIAVNNLQSVVMWSTKGLRQIPEVVVISVP